MAAKARRQHAVEHVHPEPDPADYRGRVADAHQIARAGPRQALHGGIDSCQHLARSLPHGKAADCVAVKANVDQRLGVLTAQVEFDPALNDPKKQLVRT